MKRMFMLVLAMCLVCTISFAKDVVIKQGFVITYDDNKVKNLTTVEVLKTKKVESWGKWNVLWAGWSIDAGFAYDGDALNTGALLLGREFGTLDEYFPVEFPLDDKIKITIYPIGIYANDLFGDINIKGCSGGSFLKLSVDF